MVKAVTETYFLHLKVMQLRGRQPGIQIFEVDGLYS
jgi:hypothetical protein